MTAAPERLDPPVNVLYAHVAPSLHDSSLKVEDVIQSGHDPLACNVQVQAEQALQNITAAMEQASRHRQEAAALKNQLATDQVSKYTLHMLPQPSGPAIWTAA